MLAFALTLALAPKSIAQPFALIDVKLLDGPFKTAMMANAKYLLELDPDHLLSGFRKNAGLKPKAPSYGGWESQGIAGHTLGHYLSACSQQFAATKDARYRARVMTIVDELTICQAQRRDGYVAGIPNGDRIWAEVKRGEIKSQGFDLNGGWVPWYNLHKLFAGLIDAYELTDNDRALTIATKLADWALDETKGLTDEQWQRMLACEHGGMNESLAELYAITRQQKYLALSRKFYQRAVLDPLAEGKDILAGHHANTNIPKIIGLSRLYELTGNQKDRDTAKFFWDRVVHHHSYVIGGNSNYEYFGPADTYANALSPNTSETCNTYNMLKLTRHLFAWEPMVQYADYYERALYNHILGSQDPETGMMCYYTPLLSGEHRVHSTKFDSFWCCVGSGIENHTKYGDSIYFHSAGTKLYVNLFIPSELNWKEGGVKLRMETKYPNDGHVTFRVISGSGKFTMALRHPAWADRSFAILVNRQLVDTSERAGEFAEVDRTWHTGDTIEFTLPMNLRTEAMPDQPKELAILYGPLVLAADLAAEGAPKPQTPALVDGAKPVWEWLTKQAGDSICFTTREGVGKPGTLTFRPFYQLQHRRYAVYFNEYTQREWIALQVAIRQAESRKRELEARSLDVLRVGEMQPERDHKVTGEKTYAGGDDQKWRDARDGGWFSFEMKVDPAKPCELVLSYWGLDGAGRNFDVLVDGVKLATVQLRANGKAETYDVVYSLPGSLTRGKTHITVKLQAKPGMLAGGIFGARTVRAGSEG